MEGKITAEAECAAPDDKDLQDEPQEEQLQAGYEVAEMLSECFILYESVSKATIFYLLGDSFFVGLYFILRNFEV